MQDQKNTNWGVYFFVGVLALSLGSLFTAACSQNSSPLQSPSPTAVPTPFTVTNSGTTFSPTAMTVPSGTTVTFNLAAGHTVYIDNGAGVCATNFGNTGTHVFTGTSGMVFHVHCSVHAPACGTGSCSGCVGMVMTVTIQ